MDHYAPHPGAKFEGFYTRFMLPSGGSIVTVICAIPGKQYLATITHVPGDVTTPPWQRNVWLDHLSYQDKAEGAFLLSGTGADEDAEVSLDVDVVSTTYKIRIGNELRFDATTSRRRPWSSDSASPEGAFVHLPLPLHWHVMSLASACKYNAEFPPEARIPLIDRESDTSSAHEEKNWANGFPSAHVWVQAHSTGPSLGKSRSLCLAGGKILGMEAFILGYRNEELGLEIDIRPPFALRFLGFAPFMTYQMDWETRKLEFWVRDMKWKILVEAQAPTEGFFNFHAPYAEGFKKNWMAESLRARVKVTVWRKGGDPLGMFGAWEFETMDVFENGGLEFGGEYYPSRGH